MPHTTDHLLLDDGQCLRVVRRGTQAGGRPVVCLHGWTSTHADWTHWTQALAGAHPSFAWDARAHADVPLTGAPATLERMADDLDALIRHYALERPLLLGHSMGALTIWMHALRHPGTAIGGYGLIDQTPKLVTGVGWRFGIYGDFSAQRNRWFIARQREDFAEAVLELTADGLNARARERYERE
ncbi:MAG TPA: alpha/beta hydrolase, partial [Plasticicumulans sp.]|nr:alpha/beta hydrolase [Plasticicumulans sp.]